MAGEIKGFRNSGLPRSQYVKYQSNMINGILNFYGKRNGPAAPLRRIGLPMPLSTSRGHYAEARVKVDPGMKLLLLCGNKHERKYDIRNIKGMKGFTANYALGNFGTAGSYIAELPIGVPFIMGANYSDYLRTGRIRYDFKGDSFAVTYEGRRIFKIAGLNHNGVHALLTLNSKRRVSSKRRESILSSNVDFIRNRIKTEEEKRYVLNFHKERSEGAMLARKITFRLSINGEMIKEGDMKEKFIEASIFFTHHGYAIVSELVSPHYSPNSLKHLMDVVYESAIKAWSNRYRKSLEN
ncbi:hypothetical protein ACFLZ2_04315 [Candidatus Margulisiibacteriota bacterium]